MQNNLWDGRILTSYYPYVFPYPSVNQYFITPSPYPLWNYCETSIPQYTVKSNGILNSAELENPQAESLEQVNQSKPLEQLNESHSNSDDIQRQLKIENGSSDQHFPRKSKVSKKNDNWRQKFGRNINSNIFHMAIKKIQSNQFSPLINKIIEVNKMSIKENQFLSKLNEKSRHLQTYISAKAMEKIVVGNLSGISRLDSEYRTILRILLIRYLKYDHIPHVFSSSKIKRQSRELHISGIRKLIQQLGRQ